MPVPLFPTKSEEVAELLKQLFPPGTFYDWESRYADPYKYLLGLSDFFLNYGYSVVARLWREINPATSVDKIPDREAGLGLKTTFAAQRGTTAQRQRGILAKLRESGAFTIPNVGSIFAMVLGYEDGIVPQNYETDRAALRSLHTYWQRSLGVEDQWATARRVKPTDGSNTWVDVFASKKSWCDQEWPADGGKVPRSGVYLDLVLQGSIGGDTPIDIRLTAPNARQSRIWTIAVPTARTLYRLYSPLDFLGGTVAGRWKLEMRDSVTDTREVTILSAQLFVEGMANGLADATVEWGVFADPNYLGGSGIPAQLGLAESTVKRVQHSHTIGAVLYGVPARPDVDAIPDACLPA